MPAHIAIDEQALGEFCRKWRVTEMALFGSVLRDDFRADSDVDVMVTFAPGYTPGWEIVDMQDELSAMFGRQVDLGMKRALHPRVKDRIVASSEVIFAA